MTQSKKKIHAVTHFLIALTLILKGADKLGHHPIIGSMLLLFGLVIFYFFIHALITKKVEERFELATHWFEAIANLFVAYVFFTEGATYLPYVFLLAAAGFFIAIFMHYRKVAHQ